jgi:heptose I phosphotransferase
MIYIRQDLRQLFENFRTIDDFLRIEIDAVRDFKNRKTGRFTLGQKAFYIKKHFPAGLAAVLNELFHLRKPHIGAAHERSALERLAELDIDTMKVAAFGQDDAPITKQRSFLVTDELTNVESLENICAPWPDSPPSPQFKKALIQKVAYIARTIHSNGMNHRDFYICHFLLDTAGGPQAYQTRPPKVYLIDLHRLQQRPSLTLRWQIKDIGGLYFSAMDIGLTRRDIFRFIRSYIGVSLRHTLSENKRFWRAVRRRAVRTYRKEFGKPSAPPL